MLAAISWFLLGMFAGVLVMGVMGISKCSQCMEDWLPPRDIERR
jgi:hypothetical protein